MPIKVGNKADGEDFFDRVYEREDLWRYLSKNHIVLSGPRRLGKTSLLQRMKEEAEAHGYLAELIDLEGIDSAESFIQLIDKAFPDEILTRVVKKAGGLMADLLKTAKNVKVTLPDGTGFGVDVHETGRAQWQATAAPLEERLSRFPALLLLDEFSVFLEKIAERDLVETEALLGWLRSWRQHGNPICRFVFSGSIGINSLLNRYGLSTRFNDCYDFRLEPFKKSAALEMLVEEARRENWEHEEDCLPHLCERVGWLSPFFLNLLLDGTIIAARDRLLETGQEQRVLLSADVDDAYDRLLATRSRFIHWRQRLDRDLTEPGLSFALILLSAISQSDQGLDRSQLLARLQKKEPDPDKRARLLEDILLLLEEDGYIDASGEQVRFLAFPLRDYWRNNHGR